MSSTHIAPRKDRPDGSRCSPKQAYELGPTCREAGTAPTGTPETLRHSSPRSDARRSACVFWRVADRHFGGTASAPA